MVTNAEGSSATKLPLQLQAAASDASNAQPLQVSHLLALCVSSITRDVIWKSIICFIPHHIIPANSLTTQS